MFNYRPISHTKKRVIPEVFSRTLSTEGSRWRVGNTDGLQRSSALISVVSRTHVEGSLWVWECEETSVYRSTLETLPWFRNRQDYRLQRWDIPKSCTLDSGVETLD